MKLDASLETRTSKEGKSYECVVIKISQNSEKIVFLSPAEIELLKLSHKKDDEFFDYKDKLDLR